MAALAPYTVTLWTTSDVDGKNVAVGENVYVRRRSDEALVTLYADEDGTTPLTQPLVSDSLGQVSFFVARGTYFIDSLGRRETKAINGLVTVDVLGSTEIEQRVDDLIDQAKVDIFNFIYGGQFVDYTNSVQYASGIEFTTANRARAVYHNDGTGDAVYVWAGDDSTLPFTTTGNFDEGNWHMVQRIVNTENKIAPFTGQQALDASRILVLGFDYPVGKGSIVVTLNGTELINPKDATAGVPANYTEQSGQVTINSDVEINPSDEIVVRTSYLDPESRVITLPASSIDVNSISGYSSDDQQSFNAELAQNISANLSNFESNRLASRPYAVSDAMYSWWARPMIMRYTDGTYNRTYQTFTERGGAVGIIIHDHNIGTTERYLLDTDRVPDDHNAGCVQVGDGKVVCVFGGRSNTAAPVDNCLICEWDITDTPNGGSFNKYYLDIGRDYPNLYQYENDAFLLVSQRGANSFTTGHSFRLNSWPLDENTWTPQVDLFSTSLSPDWTYVTSRRRVDAPNIIDIAVGFHPEFQSEANIYVGEIRHVGGADPWRVYANGVEIANLSTGANLPLVPSDLELAYDAPAGVKTRLFDCKDQKFVFAEYSGSDNSTAVYKYGYKSGTWQAGTIGNTGKPFYDDSSYWGGAAISENSIGQVTTAAAEGDYFRFKNYVTTDGGATWSEIDEYVVSGKAGSAITHGRPLPENASLDTIERGDSLNYLMTGWAGRYSTSDFTDYATNILTITPWNANTAMMPWQANGQAVSAKPNSFKGDLQASVASQSGDFTRERSGDFASSGVTAITRNTGAVGSRNMTFTGIIEVSGLSDTWIMGAVGANESTVGKNYSGVIGSDNCTINVGDSNNVIANAFAASGDSSTSSASSYAGAFASFGATIDADYAFMGGTQNCSSTVTGNGAVAVIGSTDSAANDSRTIVAGSASSNATQAGAAVYNSQFSDNSGQNSVIAGSRAVSNTKSNVHVGGYDAGTNPNTSNRTIELDYNNGDINHSGAINTGATFADIAKMMKNGEGVEIEAGYLVTLIGDSVYKARQGESIDGIIAATPATVHNDTPFTWQGRWLTDDFGRVVVDKNGERVENPEYKSDAEQIPRSQRPSEWSKVGVHGLIRTRVDSTVTQQVVDDAAALRENVYVTTSVTDGVGSLSDTETKVQVMAVEKEYDSSKKYGVALCLLR